MTLIGREETRIVFNWLSLREKPVKFNIWKSIEGIQGISSKDRGLGVVKVNLGCR